jgi:hypothetical protein
MKMDPDQKKEEPNPDLKKSSCRGRDIDVQTSNRIWMGTDHVQKKSAYGFPQISKIRIEK